jgi:hypothetical protein
VGDAFGFGATGAESGVDVVDIEMELGPRLFTYVMICHRDGSGRALQVGIPRDRLPFFKSQKISPSFAF